MKGPTRGERNRNPGNIRYSTEIHWLGQIPDFDRTDQEFCEFDTDLHGLRALCRVLLNYQRLDGCKTLRDVISRWAPPSENDTEAYISDVEKKTALADDQELNLADVSELSTIARAIILHENDDRCIYSVELLAQAARMALT